MSFKMDDYVDVAERIREFSAKFPEGSLQSELTFEGSGWLCRAYAYRSADDERPGIGHAFEPVPGKTPYTKDSEAMNAETSAWGRAIVALGFETKKIASRQEVQARQDDRTKASNGSGADGNRSRPAEPRAATAAPVQGKTQAAPAPSAPSFTPPAKVQEQLAQQAPSAASPPITDSLKAAAGNVVLHFSKNKGKTLGELNSKQRGWYAETWAPNGDFPVSPMDRKLRQAARVLCDIEPVIETDGPFAVSTAATVETEEIPF